MPTLLGSNMSPEKARLPEFCQGYRDEHGQWNNGFLCPKWGKPDIPYCCGDETRRYCCPREDGPHRLDGPPQQLPLVIGLAIGCLVVVIATVVTSCYYCHCCWAYKRRKRLQSGVSECSHHQLMRAPRAANYAVSYSACPHGAVPPDYMESAAPPCYPLEDPPPYPGEPTVALDDKQPLRGQEVAPGVDMPAHVARRRVEAPGQWGGGGDWPDPMGGRGTRPPNDHPGESRGSHDSSAVGQDHGMETVTRGRDGGWSRCDPPSRTPTPDSAPPGASKPDVTMAKYGAACRTRVRPLHPNYRSEPQPPALGRVCQPQPSTSGGEREPAAPPGRPVYIPHFRQTVGVYDDRAHSLALYHPDTSARATTGTWPKSSHVTYQTSTSGFEQRALDSPSSNES